MHMAFTGAANTVGLGWCGTCFVRDSDQGEQFVSEQVWQPHYASREEAYLSFLHSRHIGTNCGVMIRKLCFDKVGLFDERCIGGAEDTEFFIRFVRSFDFLVVPDTLIKIHLHQGSHLRAYSDKKAKDYELIIQKNLTALQQHPQLWISKHYKTAWLFYYGGNKAKARQYMKLALRPTFLQPKIWLTWLTFEILGVWGPTLHRKVSSWKELASMKVSSGSSQN
jgi:GT2 family glycosyltransferase